MEETIIKTKHKQAYDTEENWKTNNPILMAGQLAYSSDKYGKYKIGDGVSHWDELEYVGYEHVKILTDDYISDSTTIEEFIAGLETNTIYYYNSGNVNMTSQWFKILSLGACKTPGGYLRISVGDYYPGAGIISFLQQANNKLYIREYSLLYNKWYNDWETIISSNSIVNTFTQTTSGNPIDATQLNKDVEGSYAEYVENTYATKNELQDHEKRTFTGTSEQYEEANKNGEIEPGTIVNIIDDNDYNDQSIDFELSEESENPVANKAITNGIKYNDTKDNIVTFVSEDNTTPDEYSDVELLKTGEKHSSIFNKLSTMFKNIRYIYKMIGTTDISSIGNGTVTGAISGINTDLAQNKSFALPYASSNLKIDGLHVDLNNPWGNANKVCYVDSTNSKAIPSDCAYGVRETFYMNSKNVEVRITGVDTSGIQASWKNLYNGTTWTGWLRELTNRDVFQNVQLMQDIPHISKITIPFGNCQSIIGCLFDRVVILYAYFYVTENINAGEPIFTLPELYRPSGIIAVMFPSHDESENYYGGINVNGSIYPDMVIPARTAIRLNISYFKQ